MRWVLLCGCAISLLACVGQQKSLPMEDDKLVKVLEDIHLAEAALQNVNGATRDSLSTLYYQEICTIHQIEEATLDSTLALLRNNPVKMSKLYGRVLEKVTNRNY